jgi:cytochrome c-type biogenesis protein CcmH/NrfF
MFDIDMNHLSNAVGAMGITTSDIKPFTLASIGEFIALGPPKTLVCPCLLIISPFFLVFFFAFFVHRCRHCTFERIRVRERVRKRERLQQERYGDAGLHPVWDGTSEPNVNLIITGL